MGFLRLRLGSNFEVHNGGLSQVNPSFAQYQGEFVYLNLYKCASDITWPNGFSEVDNNGYGTVNALFFCPLQSDRPGAYVIKWTGAGTVSGPAGTPLATATFTGSIVTPGQLIAGTPTNPIYKGMAFNIGGTPTGGRIGDQISGTTNGAGTYQIVGYAGTSGSVSMSVDGGSFTTAGATGRCVIVPTDPKGRIPFNTQFGMTDYVFCHVDDEARLEAGELFGVKFMARLREANFGAIRFLDFQSNNFTNVGLYSHERPMSYAYYIGPELRKSSVVAAPTQSGTALILSAPTGFTKANRQIVTFKTGTLTGTVNQINCGSTGPDACRNFQGFEGFTFASNTIYVATWIAELNAYCVNNNLVNGHPVQAMLRLCKELRCHAQACTPVYAGDGPAGADYWGTGFANEVKAYVAANNMPWFTMMLEGPNECWNSSGGLIIVNFTRQVEWVLNGGLSPYTGNPALADGYDEITAITNVSATLGAGYSDFTFTNNIPARITVGSSFIMRDMEGNGISGYNFTKWICYAKNVGGNPKKGTFKVFDSTALTGGSGTYDGSGAWLAPYQYDNHGWYGRTFVKIMQAYVAAIGDGGAGLRTAYRFMIGVQTQYGFADQGGDQKERFLSPGGVARGQPMAYTLASDGSPANYWTPSQYYKVAEARNAYNYYITNRGNPTNQAANVANYVDSSADSGAGGEFTIPQVLSKFVDWKTYFKTLGLDIKPYEGGYSPDYSSYRWDNHNAPVGVISGASKANPCVLTLAQTAFANSLSTGDTSYLRTGQGCVVGMQLNVTGCTMTELNGSTVTCGTNSGGPGGLAFTAGSADISWTISPLPRIGMSIEFDLNGDFWPLTNIDRTLRYWVVARNTGGNTIQISATKGGTAITLAGVSSNTDMGISGYSGWRVTAVNDGTNAVTIDCDASGFTTWTATPADTYGANTSQHAQYSRGTTIVNVLRYAGKDCADSPLMPGTGLKGHLLGFYNSLLALNSGEATFRLAYPSCLSLTAERPNLLYSSEYDVSIWGVLVNIYDTPDPPQWNAIKQFNNP